MPNERAETYAYIATLLTRLYPHSLVGDLDQRKERALDYCQIYDRWVSMNPANDPTVTVGWLQTLGISIRAKAKKWGVEISFGPGEGPVIPNKCIADTLPPDDSILGQAASSLDDLVRTTGSIVGGIGKVLPILLVLLVITKVGGVMSMFDGGGRRRR